MMTQLDSTAVMVKCPHCGNRFSPEEAIGHELRAQLEQDFKRKLDASIRAAEERVQRQEGERYRSELLNLRKEATDKARRLQQLEEQSVRLQIKEAEVLQREAGMELEMKKRLLEREKAIRENAEKAALDKALVQVREREQKLEWEREHLEVILRKRISEEAGKAREEERLKHAELQKKLDDQTRLINEMKKKAEQGSMQMQGEIQELAIEEYLRSSFPRDEVEEIAKGKRGGDCVHVVKDQFERVCGRILYESKRTRHFSFDWIAKVKDDMRLKQADLGVIVTEAMPDGLNRFGSVEGVWVCSYSEFKALSHVFRHSMSRLGEVVASQENRGDKMSFIYKYVTGVEFRQKLEGAFEAYKEMQEDLEREKALFHTQWSRREKRLIKAMTNLASLYGDVRGIAGGAVQEIRALEMDTGPDGN